MILAEYATELIRSVYNFKGAMKSFFDYIKIRVSNCTRIRHYLIFFGLMVTQCCSDLSAAEAALSGEAALGYVKYEVDTNGAKAIDASTFKQRYSLIYSTKGNLANGRLGVYRLSLGYEWAAFDSKISNYSDSLATQNNPSIQSGHILYRGDISLDPAQLPLHIRLYSRDLNRTSFVNDLDPILYDHKLLSPGITTSLSDGIRTATGVQIDLGIKNSMTQGYNGLFAQLPRLYIDYQDYVTRDLKALTPTDSRLKKLAFVSLNKKDNWFHVRTANFTDHINQEFNYKETQVILGTVDEVMQRKWVDFSNWIKLSVDGQYTKHQELDDDYKYYEFNLFGVASRSRWQAKTFNTFRRIIDSSGLTYYTRLPLYMTGNVGADTDWRVRASTEQSKVVNSHDISDTLLSYRVDTFKRKPFTFMHSATIESYEDTDIGKTLTLDAHFETVSTRKFSSKYGVVASYNITSAKNESLFADDGTSYTQLLDLKGVYTPFNTLKISVSESITIANGNSDTDLTGLSGSGQPPITGSSVGSFMPPSGNFTRYRSMAKADWQPLVRLKIEFSITDDILQNEGRATEHGNEYENTVAYTNRFLRARLRTRYITSSAAYISSTNFIGEGHLSYSPARSLESSITYSYSDFSGNDSYSNTYSTIRQSTNYYLYTTYGVNRRILELNQSLEYDDQKFSSGYRNKTKSLLGGFRYYPLSRMFIAAKAKYSLLSRDDTTQKIYNATVGINFNLMQATLDYSYGRQNGGGERLEKRLEANLRKSF